MHNAIGLLYQKALLKAFRQHGERTLSQVRSSGALAAGLPFVLYSDLYNHREFIRGVVNSGFSGLLWAPEVRGCDSTDDLIRRLQTTVFSHHALLNCWRIPSPPWVQVDTEKNLQGEVQANSTEVTEICRKYFEMRMRLIPYLYSAFARYNQTGFPPIRALVMDFEDDENVRMMEDEYMFGESLLVCPMTVEDGTSRSIYLPKGIWYDFWTRKKHEGGKRFDFTAEVGIIPVFVKDNSIVPLAEPVQFVAEDTVFDVTVCCFGSGEKKFELYEDDGRSFAYEKGDCRWIQLLASPEDVSSIVETGTTGKPRHRFKAWEFVR